MGRVLSRDNGHLEWLLSQSKTLRWMFRLLQFESFWYVSFILANSFLGFEKVLYGSKEFSVTRGISFELQEFSLGSGDSSLLG